MPDTAAICLIVNERLTRNLILHQPQTRFDPLTLSGTVLLRSIPYNGLLRGPTQYFGYKKQHVCQNASTLITR
jgi:hypothetical protein